MTKDGIIVHVNAGGVGFLKESNSDHHYVFNFDSVQNTAPTSNGVIRSIRVGVPVQFATSASDSEVVTEVILKSA